MSLAAPRRRGRARQRLLPLLALVLAGACARHAQPPTAASPPPRPFDLTGVTVMILPAQAPAATPLASATAFDTELDYWLKDRAPRVRWIPASEVERLAGSPSLRLDLHALDVRAFGRMRVQRIGDPLFGDVHNLGAMFDARLALLPASLAYVSPHDSAGAALPGPGHFEVTAALIQTFGGEVVWYAVIPGEAGPIDAPATMASAARALARALTPRN